MQETWVRSLGWEDLLEKGMAKHSSILAWEITWTEELDGLAHLCMKCSLGVSNCLDEISSLPYSIVFLYLH